MIISDILYASNSLLALWAHHCYPKRSKHETLSSSLNRRQSEKDASIQPQATQEDIIMTTFELGERSEAKTTCKPVIANSEIVSSQQAFANTNF